MNQAVLLPIAGKIQLSKNKTFLGLLIFLMALSGYLLVWGPLFMGYEKETALSALALWQGGFQIFRAGIGAVLMYLPFVALGKIFFPQHLETFLTLVPLIYSALAVWVIFLGISKLTGKTAISALITVLIAFGSLLMPYSRIGMEYQSTLLLILLWLSLLHWQKKQGSLLLCGLVLMALALSKSYGIVFAFPALIFIVGGLEKQNRFKFLFSWHQLLKLLGPAILGMATVMFINHHLYGQWSGAYFLRQEFQVWSWWEGWFGTFFAFGKSILLYNPLLIVAIFYWPAFLKRFRPTAIFILSAFFVLMVLTAPFSFWSDETLSVRKLVPVIPLLHLPLLLAWEHKLNLGWLKNSCLGIIIVLALYFQCINSLYPYWRQLEFLRPYNLDTLTTIRYNPRLSNLALNNRFFFSFVSDRLIGKSGSFYYFEKSWMRCCTYPPEKDSIITKIQVDLRRFERPDIYLLSARPLPARELYGILDMAVLIFSGSWLTINIIGYWKTEERGA